MVFSFYFEMIFRFTVNKMQTHGLHGNKNVWHQVHSKNSLKAASLTPEHQLWNQPCFMPASEVFSVCETHQKKMSYQ